MGVPNKHLGEWRSIEFELIFKDYKYLQEFKKFVDKKNYTKFVDIHDDYSIEASYDDYYDNCKKCNRGVEHHDCDDIAEQEPKEIAVSYRSGNEKIIYDVCKFFKKTAYVNDTCGTHVHFDMRHVDKNMVRLYGARIGCVVPALKKIVPKWRRDNEYCAGNVNTLYDYNDSYGSYEEDKYSFINLQSYYKHKTIEVRGHSGTLDAKKILNWISICEKVMFNDKTYSADSVKELIKKYKFNKRLSSFMKDRSKILSKRNYQVSMEM